MVGSFRMSAESINYQCITQFNAALDFNALVKADPIF